MGNKVPFKDLSDTKDKVIWIIKELIPYVIIILVAVLIRTFIATPVIVDGPSMEPTLYNKDLVILKKYGDYERFAIVVATPAAEGEEKLVKRIIGLPGETIEVRAGVIYINGQELKDKYGAGYTNNMNPVKLGNEEYFVMGDNREISLDSRSFGPITEKEIQGTTSFVFFPFKRFGSIN